MVWQLEAISWRMQEVANQNDQIKLWTNFSRIMDRLQEELLQLLLVAFFIYKVLIRKLLKRGMADGAILFVAVQRVFMLWMP